ncbi:hypothetical protein PR048_017537 [Dryococelus australis]|uniref:Uncharacterized protein n=1 Tax=Dryococelus australis TaxID=614101 RepID=A0ABQ9H9V3_9NEOP|nr:hypothetical protein PR048_017537 [Dryococelus australis]
MSREKFFCTMSCLRYDEVTTRNQRKHMIQLQLSRVNERPVGFTERFAFQILTSEVKKLTKPTQAVLKLSTPMEGPNRNFTFSFVVLVDKLLQKGLACERTSGKYHQSFYHTNIGHYSFNLMGLHETKLSYLTFRKKMHHSSASYATTGISEIICFYNMTKVGVDTLDKKCSIFSTGTATKRWPTAIFYALLNIASSIYTLHQSFRNNVLVDRFVFVDELGTQLIEPHLRRYQQPSMQKDL